MKTRLMLILVGAITAVTALANSTPGDEVTARWARVNAVAAYFRPTPDGQKWVDKKLSDLVPVDDISKIILIAAMTSAPDEINIFNIFKILQNDATFYQLDGKYPVINVTYKAIIVSKDHHVFQIEIGRDPDGNGLSRLTSEKGNYGYFK